LGVPRALGHSPLAAIGYSGLTGVIPLAGDRLGLGLRSGTTEGGGGHGRGIINPPRFRHREKKLRIRRG
jgi:hypothetical protein